jgi:O-antigen ligase
MDNFRKNLLKYGVFILVLVAPIIFWSHGLSPHISSKTFFIYGATEILLSIWLYTIIVDKSYRLSKKTLVAFLPAIGFVSWMTLAGIFAVNPMLSFWSGLDRGTGLLTLYHCLALSFIVASLVRKHGKQFIEQLFTYFIVGGFILALSVWMGTDGFKLSATVLKTDAGGGLSGNSTLAAGYFLFILAMAGYLLCIKSISTGIKWFIGIAGATIIFSPVFASLYGLFSGHSMLGTARGTILALVTGIMVTLLGYLFLSKKKVVRGASLATFSVGLIVFAFMWMQLITPGTSLHQKFAEQARSTRFIFWDIASKSMHEHPLLGYGPENFMIAFQSKFDAHVLMLENSFEGWVDRAHNIYYDLGVSGGYPVIILYAIFISSLLYSLYILNKKEKLTRIQTSVLIGFIFAYIANNLFTFDSNISLMGLFIISGILYGLAQDTTDKKLEEVKIDKSNKNLIALGLAVLFVFCWILFVYRPVHKSRLYAEVFSSAVNRRPEMYSSLLGGSSVGEQWDVSDLAYGLYKKYSANPPAVKNDARVLPYAIKDVDSLLVYLDKISEENKTDSRLYLTKALFQNHLKYLTDKPYDENVMKITLANLEYAKQLSPTNPNIYWSIAQTKIWAGDLKGTEEAYREAINIATYLPSNYDSIIRYATIVGNQKLFNEMLKKAKENIPGYEFK